MKRNELVELLSLLELLWNKLDSNYDGKNVELKLKLRVIDKAIRLVSELIIEGEQQ